MKVATLTSTPQHGEETQLEAPHLDQYAALAATVKRNIADIGAYSTHMVKSWVGMGPQLILPYDSNRQGARLICGELPGFTGSATLVTAPGNPAAGASFVYTVPAGPPVTLQSVKYTLITSAAVLNRFVYVRIQDALGNQLAESADPQAIPASTTVTMFLSSGITLNPSGTGGTLLGGLPALQLQPGWTVTIGGTPLDAADQVQSINFTTQATSTASAFQGVYLGKRKSLDNFIQQGSLAGGGIILPVGSNIPIANNEETYAYPIGTPDGGSFLSVLNEKWRNINAVD